MWKTSFFEDEEAEAEDASDLPLEFNPEGEPEDELEPLESCCSNKWSSIP